MASDPKGSIPAENFPTYQPTHEENKTISYVLNDFVTGRNVINRSYAQFNNINLYQAIDDWQQRWNGYIPSDWYPDDFEGDGIFLNFTRNQVITYLSKLALQQPDVKIAAVNKKTGVADRKFAEVLKDLNKYSLLEENGDARFLEAAFEVTVKGTVIVYEGYAKHTQETKIPESFDAETGKIKYKKGTRTIFDNCYQKVVPLEDMYIANPYEPNIQKQPFLIWRTITTYNEAQTDFEHYANFKFVRPGSYTLTSEPTTFYRNKIYTELSNDQVEIVRYYNRQKNQHIVLINGVIMYDGPIPFKDGMYPFAKTIFEPFDNSFFWGSSLVNKIMGEQDLLNETWNTMSEKNRGSLRPYGLSSDLDDIIEDDVLRVNKIRKVSDINKWKFDTLPGVSSAEIAMLQQTLNFARENSGDITGVGSMSTPKGGKVPVRQVLLKQQEAMQRMSYSLYFLEDLERDRTLLRINHILQFYSIPKMEKITGKSGKELEQLVYRDIKLNNVKLSDGKLGTKVIKLINTDEVKNPDNKTKLQDDLSMLEAMGDVSGTPTEALAVNVDTFYDYNFMVEIVKNSSYEKNQVLDQASRMEYANWRLSLAQIAPVDASELVKYVEESYDIDTDRFTPKQQPGNPMQQGMNPMQPQNPAAVNQPPQSAARAAGSRAGGPTPPLQQMLG